MGAWQQWQGEFDPRCEVCGNDPYDCVCPECPTCGVSGDPECYKAHGMEKTCEQIDAAIKNSPDTVFPDDVNPFIAEPMPPGSNPIEYGPEGSE